MPEEWMENIKKRVQPQWVRCFVVALVFGLIAHLYKMTNWLPNWDSLVFRYDTQNMLAIGRWFLPVATAFSSFYDLPWLTGLLAVILHGLGAVCICRLFEVKKTVTAVLVGAVVATFPTVTSVMMYNYVADGYALSFLFACLAALCLTREKLRYSIVAVVLIALSVGIYQAYITVTIMLLLCYLIRTTLQSDVTAKRLLQQSVRFLIVGALGMALYYGMLQLLLSATGTMLLEYQGVAGAASLSGLDIGGALYTMKEALLGYFFDFSKGINVFGVLNILVVLVTVALYLAEVIKAKLGAAKLALLCVFVIALPFGAVILCLINSGVDYHNLMKMGFVVFYLFFILQYEKTATACRKANAAVSWMILVLASVVVFNQVAIANISYHKLQMAYEKSYGTLIRIADRLEQTGGATGCEKLLVIGSLENSEDYSVNLPPDMTGTTDGYILRADDEIVGQSVLCSALNDYCETEYTFVAGEEKTELLEWVDTENMGVWPANDSVLVHDGVVILKLGNEEVR